MRAIFYSTVDYRWDFLRWQFQALQHFVGDGTELVVWNNATDARSELRQRVHEMCEQLSVRCYRVGGAVNELSTIAHSRALEWGWQNVVMNDRPDVAVLLDFDLIPLAPTSVAALLGGAQVSGCQQRRGAVHYFWPGLLALDLQRLRDPEKIRFSHGSVDGENLDTGGMLSLYLREYAPEVRGLPCTGQIRRAGDLSVLPAALAGAYEDVFNFEVFDRAWFHYGAGSNWNRLPPDVIERKTRLFFAIAERCLRGESALWSA